MQKMKQLMQEAEAAMKANHARVVHVVVKRGRKVIREFDVLLEKKLYHTAYGRQGGHHG